MIRLDELCVFVINSKRKENLQMAKTLLSEGKKSEALNYFQRCVDVTPDMALAFIKVHYYIAMNRYPPFGALGMSQGRYRSGGSAI